METKKKLKYLAILAILQFLACFFGCQNLNAQEVDSGKVLLASGESNAGSTRVLTATGKGVFLLKQGKELVSIENRDEIPPIIFPDDLYVEDAIFSTIGLFIKCRDKIYLCKDSIIPFFSFDSSNFTLASANDDNLYVIVNTDNNGRLYYLNCFSREVHSLASFPEKIVNAFGTKDEAFVVTDHSIYLLSDNKAKKILSFFCEIVTASFTESGLFFATNYNLLLFIEEDTVGVIQEQGCKQLVTDKGLLYVYNDDGSLICYEAKIVKS